ncbi:helix-turn-helix transcriptional regulator [Cupriavidus metallidurans]|uniref:Uncharacterized protein n=1 Tax=Cupriavidus metallidurans (strain ATCC 43123 / DSM 2839 / NBRC 102507 / CH34) TaxID=266264 RepID=Q1LGV7_CUPMC|nr:WYL domain-containing protein [Cupriavidus metallidurans]ABF10619.1 conserved hypothetical protein [Cupriavidus metallidurans CH34]QGS31906.1 WYL domain-containing protein [Cupriavidus metallidurans]
MKRNSTHAQPLSDLAITTLELMASRPDGYPSGELQSALEGHADRRTIRRALSELETCGFAKSDGATKGRVWKALSPTPGGRRPSVNEAIALLTLRHLAYRHLPASVVGALEADFIAAAHVLDEHPTASNLAAARLWLDKTARLHAGYPLVAPAIKDELFQIVGHALYNDESLDITYRTSRESAPKQYRALPHALIEKGPLWYLIVKNKRRTAEGSMFSLRMDRIIDARPAGIDLTRDRTFNLDAYIRKDKSMEFFAGKPVQLVLRVNEMIDAKRIEHAFRSLHLSDDQTIVEEDGGFLLVATVVPSVPLTNLLLEKSTTVEIVAPPDMREGMIAHLKRALSRYEHGSAPVENLDTTGPH